MACTDPADEAPLWLGKSPLLDDIWYWVDQENPLDDRPVHTFTELEDAVAKALTFGVADVPTEHGCYVVEVYYNKAGKLVAVGKAPAGGKT